MVTGPLYDDLAVLQGCRAYEEAAGLDWPTPELVARLDQIARPVDDIVIGKRWANETEA
jgi:hypothetical protein